MKILKIDPYRPERAVLRAAAASLREGRLAVLPTETVYGLAADPAIPGAVEALYNAKRRPDNKPIAFFIREAADISLMDCEPGAVGESLARRFWPGPLTLVCPAASGYTGFRVPDHAVPLGLLREGPCPLAVTSANLSGKPPARTVQAAVAALENVDGTALDAGPCGQQPPSTVVRVTGDEAVILRRGAIEAREIEAAVNAAKGRLV